VTPDLAPLDLNLLGAPVVLEEVHLLIETVHGARNLLSNLSARLPLPGAGSGRADGSSNLLTAVTNPLIVVQSSL
jgi:hypothetical protein